MREDWIEVELNELSTFELGGDWGKAPDFEDENYVKVFCIRGSEFRNWDNEKGITSALRKIKKASLEKRKLKENDILVEISGGGPEQPVGRTVVIDKSVLQNFKGKSLIYTNFLRLIRPTNYADSVYINLYLKYFYSTGEIIRYQGGSNNLRNLKFKDFLTIKIPLAPLPIQRAIVHKIENLFASLDKGIADLKTAHEQLKVYRQAVLKKAFEGEFTNRDVKEGELPEGWKLLRLEELINSIEYGTSTKSSNNGLVPVLRMGNIQNGVIDWEDLKFTDDITEIKKYKLKYNDVLFNRTNSPEHVGKTAIYKSNRDAIFAGYLIRINYHQEKVNPDYLNHYLNSYEAKQYGNQH